MNHFKIRDYEDSNDYSGLSPSQCIQVYCTYICCDNDQSAAYKCNNILCPLHNVKERFLPKPHRLSDNKIEQLRKQLEINRNKSKNV